MNHNWFILRDDGADAGGGSAPAISTEPQTDSGNVDTQTTPAPTPGQITLDQQTYQSLLSAQESARGNNAFFERAKSNGLGSFDDIPDEALGFIAKMKQSGLPSGSYGQIIESLFNEQSDQANGGANQPMTMQDVERMVNERVQTELGQYSSKRDRELQYRSEYDKQYQAQNDAINSLRQELGIPGDLSEIKDDSDPMQKMLYYALIGAQMESYPGIIQDENHPMNGRPIPLGENEIGTLKEYFSGIKDRLASSVQFNAARNVNSTPPIGGGSNVSGGQQNPAAMTPEDQEKEMENQLLKIAEQNIRARGGQPIAQM